ncbi:endonuclease [Bacteroidia bacterium]|nr:endonuclease [Bacteroidia bacterium]
MVPAIVFGWSKTGHRVIGQIAENIMTEQAKSNMNAVLNNAGAAMVANWGDFVKSDPRFKQFSSWHYTNFTSNLTREKFDKEAIDTFSGQCIFRIIQLTEILRENPNDVNCLKMLIHIVGDMFQPMHLGSPYDLGGNKVPITWFGQKSNLHSLWDDKLIDGEKLSYTEYAQFLMNTKKPSAGEYSKQAVLDAAWKAYQITCKIYDEKDKVSDHYVYIYNYKSIWEQQFVDGGILLGTILNYIYGK